MIANNNSLLDREKGKGNQNFNYLTRIMALLGYVMGIGICSPNMLIESIDTIYVLLTNNNKGFGQTPY